MKELRIEDRLPLTAPRDFSKSEYYNNLGGAFISFIRESVPADSDYDYMTQFNFDFVPRAEHHWGAYCNCSECLDSFYAGFYSTITGHKGILLAEGDDGQTYPGWVRMEDDFVQFYQEGYEVNCPMCGAPAHLISATRAPRKYAERVTMFENLGGLGALITYELRRELDPRNPDCIITAAPVAALVKIEDGRIWTYSFFKGKWKRNRSFRDPNQVIYHDYDSVCYRKFGGSYEIPKAGATAGTTMEKTGLEEYIRGGGIHPHIYLRLQARYPNLENLIKSRMGFLLRQTIDEQIEQNLNYGYYPTIDLPLDGIGVRAARPHTMLGLTRDELRTLDIHSIDEMRLYKTMKTEGMIRTPAEYSRYTEEYTVREIETLAAVTISLGGRISLERISNYIRRERDEFGGLGIVSAYRDYINMLPAGEHTDEELLPKNLRARHDELTELIKFRENAERTAQFRELKERYSGLEYSDGRLCALLPGDPQELISEGRTLRHCVGGYVDEHMNGKKIIVFIRHSRRPERSYYTLNIDLTDLKRPREIQLHGYGNERHGEHKEYKHSIPRSVREFCDEYEENIVRRWCLQQLRAQQMSRKVG